MQELTVHSLCLTTFPFERLPNKTNSNQATKCTPQDKEGKIKQLRLCTEHVQLRLP